MIQPAVLAAWRPWNEPLEGVVYWMYLDTLGLVTTGLGNMIEPVSRAAQLPWKHADGTLASVDEIDAEFAAVKTNTALARQGAWAAERVTTLRLTDADIDAFDQQTLAETSENLTQHLAFAAFDDWPADAQLGILSMAWAMGPGFGPDYPHFSAAVAIQDWQTASTQCAMQDRGGDISNRNKATATAFVLAQYAKNKGLDAGVLLSPVPPVISAGA